MRDEVYNWGSFLQSRMYAAGVTCSDCHDPHAPKVQGRAATTSAPSCHRPSASPRRKHHFHREKGKGASCVACHMRTETYMVVDPRHDHSFRVAAAGPHGRARPRERARTPATTATATARPQWAARAVRRWYPEGRQDEAALRDGPPRGPHASSRARSARSSADRARPEAAGDRARHGGVAPAARTSGPSRCRRSRRRPRDPDPLVRLGAATTLEALPPKRARADRRRTCCGTRCGRCASRRSPAFADVPDAELATRGAGRLRPLARRLLPGAAVERRAARVARQPRHRRREARDGSRRPGATTTRRCASRRGSSPPT